MRYAHKKGGKHVQAYELGKHSDMEKFLIQTGAIRYLADGNYELFSQEAFDGQGELAGPGDYFKVDEKEGIFYPYPNKREYFLANHRHITGDEYEQIPRSVAVWQAGDELCQEMRYLLESGKLILKPDQEDQYFHAVLFGAPLSAAKDAVLVFYQVEKDHNGQITSVDFNFVARREFDRDYIMTEGE